MPEPRKGGPAATSVGVQGRHRTPRRLCGVEAAPRGAGRQCRERAPGRERGRGHKGRLPLPRPQRG